MFLHVWFNTVSCVFWNLLGYWVVHRWQVAIQLAGAMTYLTRMKHIAWDLHAVDLVIDSSQPCRPWLTLLDVFMQPCEKLDKKVQHRTVVN